MPFVNLHLQGSNPFQPPAPTELVKVLLDSGSRYNLLSPALDLRLTQNNLTASSEDVPQGCSSPSTAVSKWSSRGSFSLPVNEYTNSSLY